MACSGKSRPCFGATFTVKASFGHATFTCEAWFLLKTFAPDDTSDAVDGIRELAACRPPIQDSFDQLARQTPETGHEFLCRRWRGRRVDGPILVAIDNGMILGAIGPLAVMPNRNGASVLVPQYFG